MNLNLSMEAKEVLSMKVKNIPGSATIQMSQLTQQLKKQGQSIIDLSIGEPSFDTPEYIQEEAAKAILSSKYFKYPPISGYDDLREAIALKLNTDNNIECSYKQVLVTAGSKQAIYNTLLSIINPGDEVLIFSPYWGSYSDITLLVGGIPTPVKGDIKNNFKPTIEEIDKKITKNTKAILFSSPCNPTGSVFSKEYLIELANIVAKRPDIIIISDEIYEHINFTDNHFSIGSLDNVKRQTVTINGFSKSYCMAGWRLGYLCGPQYIVDTCQKIQSQTTSSVCSISQRAALAALNLDNSILKVNKDSYLEKMKISLSLLNQINGVDTNLPEGAFYIFPNMSYYLKNSIKDTNTLCMYLLEKAKVSTVPGIAFGEPNNIRISYTAKNEDLIAGINNMKCALEELI